MWWNDNPTKGKNIDTLNMNTLTNFLWRISRFFSFGKIVIPPTRNDILHGYVCIFFCLFVPPHYI